MTVDASRSCLGLATCVGPMARRKVEARVLLTAAVPPALPRRSVVRLRNTRDTLAREDAKLNGPYYTAIRRTVRNRIGTTSERGRHPGTAKSRTPLDGLVRPGSSTRDHQTGPF